MATKAQIIKFAGSHLGYKVLSDSQIVSHSRDPLALQGLLWIDHARDQLLTTYPWVFATVRKRLVEKTFDPVETPSYDADWQFAYHYPDQCVQIQYVYDPAFASEITKERSTPYSVEYNPSIKTGESRQLILTNASNASAIFTTNCIEYEHLPPHFVEPLSLLLASKVAFTITQSPDLKIQLTNMYISTLRSFHNQDASQQHDKEPKLPEALLAREGLSGTIGTLLTSTTAR